MSDKRFPSRTSAIAPNTGLSRRALLKGSAALAGSAALLQGLQSAFPSGAYGAVPAPETKRAMLGYIALTDAAPLIVAKEMGIFTKYGMPDVDVAKQASWAATRDNLVLGSEGGGIDGAHILSPLPYLMTTGKVTTGNTPVPMYILARLNLDCQGISVSNEYKDLKVGLDASPLKAAFAKKKAAGQAVNVAMTFPGGTHDMWIRYWLAAGGIDPDKEVSMVTVPPPQMVANMKVGTTEAFCVGEPWNEQLVNQNIGFTALTTGELWGNHPEKALGMRASWVDKNPNAANALLMAVMEAQMWCDKPENKDAMADILGRRQWFNVPVADIIGRIKGDINYGNGRVAKGTKQYMKFWAGGASYPYQSHDLWFLTENQRWGTWDMNLDTKALVAKVNREDLWRTAATNLSVAAVDIPATKSRGKETFFDGKVFDPENPAGYLKSLAISRAV